MSAVKSLAQGLYKLYCPVYYSSISKTRSHKEFEMTAKTASAGTHIVTFTGRRAEVVASIRNLAITGVDFEIKHTDLHRFGTSSAIVEFTVPAGMELTIG